MRKLPIAFGLTLVVTILGWQLHSRLLAKDAAGDGGDKQQKQDGAKDNKDAKKSDDKKSDDKKKSDDSHAWVTVKTFSGSTTGKEKDLKFQTTTKEWRVTFDTTHVGSG